jgi:hypothetical protein
MLKRDEGRARSAPGVGPAPRAFMQLSADGAAELDEKSPRRKAAAILLSFLVLLAVPLYLAAMAQGSAGDQPLAVKSSDEDDDNEGQGGDDDNEGPGGDDDSGLPSATGTATSQGDNVTNGTTNDTAQSVAADDQDDGPNGTATTHGGNGTQGTTNDTNVTKTGDSGQPSATGTATTDGQDGTQGTSHNG